MGTLIIHPTDETTDFLKPIYDDHDTAIIREDMSAGALAHVIDWADTTIMMGHGSPTGLMSVGRFWGGMGFAINHETTWALRHKQNVYIWCYASDYMIRHELEGFATGMFISDVGEAAYLKVPGTSAEVDESNAVFAAAINSKQTPAEMFDACRTEYAYLARSNPVARYNAERMRYDDGQTTWKMGL